MRLHKAQRVQPPRLQEIGIWRWDLYVELGREDIGEGGPQRRSCHGAPTDSPTASSMENWSWRARRSIFPISRLWQARLERHPSRGEHIGGGVIARGARAGSQLGVT